MEKIPPETLCDIMELAATNKTANPRDLSQFANFCLVSRHWLNIAQPQLYFFPRFWLRSRTSPLLFVCTLDEKPELGKLVHGLQMDMLPEMTIFSQQRACAEMMVMIKACPNLEHLRTEYGSLDICEVFAAVPKLKSLVSFLTRWVSVQDPFPGAPNQLEMLHIFGDHGGVRVPELFFPRLRHLSFNTERPSKDEVGCFNSFSTIANLCLRIDEVTPCLSKALASFHHLDNLSLSVTSSLRDADLTILDCLSSVQILCLTLTHVSSSDELISLFEQDKPALKGLKSLRVHLSPAIHPEDVEQAKAEIGVGITDVCKEKGITFLGFMEDWYTDFWQVAAPEFHRFIEW